MKGTGATNPVDLDIQSALGHWSTDHNVWHEHAYFRVLADVLYNPDGGDDYVVAADGTTTLCDGCSKRTIQSGRFSVYSGVRQNDLLLKVSDGHKVVSTDWAPTVTKGEPVVLTLGLRDLGSKRLPPGSEITLSRIALYKNRYSGSQAQDALNDKSKALLSLYHTDNNLNVNSEGGISSGPNLGFLRTARGRRRWRRRTGLRVW